MIHMNEHTQIKSHSIVYIVITDFLTKGPTQTRKDPHQLKSVSCPCHNKELMPDPSFIMLFLIINPCYPTLSLHEYYLNECQRIITTQIETAPFSSVLSPVLTFSQPPSCPAQTGFSLYFP